MVLRVQRITDSVPSHASTYSRVSVATPDRWVRKFSATRSPVSRVRARPATPASSVPGSTHMPSTDSGLHRTSSSSSNVRRATCRPAGTPAAFATNTPLACRSSGTVPSVVTSPGPTSSSSARRSVSSRSAGSSGIVGSGGCVRARFDEAGPALLDEVDGAAADRIRVLFPLTVVGDDEHPRVLLSERRELLDHVGVVAAAEHPAHPAQDRLLRLQHGQLPRPADHLVDELLPARFAQLSHSQSSPWEIKRSAGILEVQRCRRQPLPKHSSRGTRRGPMRSARWPAPATP